ncbi:MAG: glycine cleavage system protein H [SAR202 cluster bacterium Io17-Chloro-G9]|nr:MAG: glycine cleavage system protein H [SAR202 cluster bacterium Io17-Chloro-G9]
MNPNDRKYTKEHEWIKPEDQANQALTGITDYAQDQLGDIVYFELPKPGDSVKQFEKIGEVESVKAVSDLYSPITGEVLEANEKLMDHPELANQDPFEEGWLIRVSIADRGEMDSLMSAEEYESFIGDL